MSEERGCVAVGDYKEWRGLCNYSFDGSPTKLLVNIANKLKEEIKHKGKRLKQVCEEMLQYSEWCYYYEGGIDPHETPHITKRNWFRYSIDWIYIINPQKEKLYVVYSFFHDTNSLLRIEEIDINDLLEDKINFYRIENYGKLYDLALLFIEDEVIKKKLDEKIFNFSIFFEKIENVIIPMVKRDKKLAMNEVVFRFFQYLKEDFSKDEYIKEKYYRKILEFTKEMYPKFKGKRLFNKYDKYIILFWSNIRSLWDEKIREIIYNKLFVLFI
jgi:hypothetical protein